VTKSLPKLVISVISCELVGILSTPFTVAAIPTWYAYLIKPPFSPPNWIFAPVWTTLYLFMGISFYLIWIQDVKKPAVRKAIRLFFIQLGLNFIWSILFFGLHSAYLGLADIVVLWLVILCTMKNFYRLSRPAYWLLFPYLAWVTFAMFLNASIFLLN
jgi:translocator protein